jgi:hypothetical protein
MPSKLAVGLKVRFTSAWLAKLSEVEARRYHNRIGVIHGYRLGADSPIVLFPKEGRRIEQKLFEVDVCTLEIVPSAD